MSVQANPLEQLTLEQLRRRTSAKWRVYPDDVLPAFVAEMDASLAQPVVQAVTRALELGDTGYSWGRGYADALADFAQQRWSWNGVSQENTLVVADVMRGIAEVLELVSGPGEAVIINPPVYPPFHHVATDSGRPLVEAPLDEGGRIDFAVLEAAFTRAVGFGPRPVYLLCNPHNPHGTVHTREELAEVARLARHHGIRVISDEIHAPLVFAGARFVPYVSVAGADGFSVTSASKAWNLAGFKAAVVVAGPEAVDDLKRHPKWHRSDPSHVGEIAHTAAMRDGGPWLDALLAGLESNRSLLADLLAEHLPGVDWTPGAGTYLAWLDCRGLGLGDDPAAAFLRKGRVALSSGLHFGTGGAGWVRLNFATSPELLTEVVRRMALGR